MSESAGGVHKPRKLSDLIAREQGRVGSVAIVNAFGLVGRGRPVSSWLVSSLCPFGCSANMHTFVSGWDLPRYEGDRVEYCDRVSGFYSVIVPESLQLAALHVTVVPYVTGVPS